METMWGWGTGRSPTLGTAHCSRRLPAIDVTDGHRFWNRDDMTGPISTPWPVSPAGNRA